MTITVLISATGHMVVAGIDDYLLLTLFCFFFPGGVTQTFIPERYGQFLVLPGLGCCNLPLTLITGHGNTKRHPNGSFPVFHT